LQQAVTAHLTGTLLIAAGTHIGLQTVAVHTAMAPSLLFNNYMNNSDNSSDNLLDPSKFIHKQNHYQYRQVIELVGVGQLGGLDSIIETLRKKGYKVTKL